jgi:hydrogenase maturation protease
MLGKQDNKREGPTESGPGPRARGDACSLKPVACSLVLGYGNTLCGDDGVGPAVAEAIAALRLPGVTTHTCHQLTPELAETVSEYEHIFFVDASVKLNAGEVRWQEVSPADSSPSALGHHLSPPALLAWRKSLFGRAPSATIIAIGARDLEPGPSLSPPVRAAVQRVAQQFAAKLANRGCEVSDA